MAILSLWKKNKVIFSIEDKQMKLEVQLMIEVLDRKQGSLDNCILDSETSQVSSSMSQNIVSSFKAETGDIFLENMIALRRNT